MVALRIGSSLRRNAARFAAYAAFTGGDASDEAMHNKEAGSLTGLLHHKRAVLTVQTFTMGGSLYFYIFTAYMQEYLVNTAHMDPTTVSRS
jgi:hypothetical protein